MIVGTFQSDSVLDVSMLGLPVVLQTRTNSAVSTLTVSRKVAIATVAAFLATLMWFPLGFVSKAIAGVACTCPKGGTLSGTSCTIPSSTISARVSGFSCPTGFIQSGNTCTASVPTRPRPGLVPCPPGSPPGSVCAIIVQPSCPSGLVLNDLFQCTGPATPTFSCPINFTLSGTTCKRSSSTFAAVCSGQALATAGQAAIQASRAGFTAVQTQVQSIHDRIQSQARSSSPPIAFAEEMEEKRADTPFNALGFADGMPTKAPIYKAPPKPAEPGISYSGWAQGFGDYDNFNRDFAGIDFGRITRTAGGVAGFDATIPHFLYSDAFVIGVIGGGTFMHEDAADGSNLQLNGPSVGLYTVWVNGGFSTDSVTKVDFFNLNSISPDGVSTPLGMTNYTTAYNVYYKFQMNNGWWLEPTGGISYNTNTWDGASRALGFENGTDWRAQAGARMGTSFNWMDVTVNSTLTALAYDDFSVTGNTLTSAAFGPTTLVPTDQGYIFGEVIGRLEFDFGKGLTCYIEGEFRGSAIEYGAAGRVGLRYVFGSP
jgi:hypothetical protein